MIIIILIIVIIITDWSYSFNCTNQIADFIYRPMINSNCIFCKNPLNSFSLWDVWQSRKFPEKKNLINEYKNHFRICIHSRMPAYNEGSLKPRKNIKMVSPCYPGSCLSIRCAPSSHTHSSFSDSEIPPWWYHLNC